MRINEHRAKTLRDATANGNRLFYLFDFLSLPCQLPHPPHPPPQPPPPQPLDPHPPPPQPLGPMMAVTRPTGIFRVTCFTAWFFR